MATKKTHCKRGHLYAKWAYVYKDKRGYEQRRCRLCRSISSRLAYANRKNGDNVNVDAKL